MSSDIAKCLVGGKIASGWESLVKTHEILDLKLANPIVQKLYLN